jgi:hypothetical protein
MLFISINEPVSEHRLSPGVIGYSINNVKTETQSATVSDGQIKN